MVRQTIHGVNCKTENLINGLTSADQSLIGGHCSAMIAMHL
jgi:hypothetical protein